MQRKANDFVRQIKAKMDIKNEKFEHKVWMKNLGYLTLKMIFLIWPLLDRENYNTECG